MVAGCFPFLRGREAEVVDVGSVCSTLCLFTRRGGVGGTAFTDSSSPRELGSPWDWDGNLRLRDGGGGGGGGGGSAATVEAGSGAAADEPEASLAAAERVILPLEDMRS